MSRVYIYMVDNQEDNIEEWEVDSVRGILDGSMKAVKVYLGMTPEEKETGTVEVREFDDEGDYRIIFQIGRTA